MHVFCTCTVYVCIHDNLKLFFVCFKILHKWCHSEWILLQLLSNLILSVFKKLIYDLHIEHSFSLVYDILLHELTTISLSIRLNLDFSSFLIIANNAAVTIHAVCPCAHE